MQQKFTRAEVVRMLGIRPRQIDLWAKQGLVPRSEDPHSQVYGFADLLALKTLKGLAAEGVPSRNLGKALEALRKRMGDAALTLSNLYVAAKGKKVVIGAPGRAPIEPISGQMLFAFDARGKKAKVRSLPSRSAEEWFEIGLAYDTDPATMHEAADAYRHAVRVSPRWVEARLNLGTALFHLGDIKEAHRCFKKSLELAPDNVLANMNVGCTLERLGNRRAAIASLRRAVSLAPDSADAHLNMALLYDADGQADRMRTHLAHYLRLQPEGRWAGFARSRLPSRSRTGPGKVTPFRRRGEG